MTPPDVRPSLRRTVSWLLVLPMRAAGWLMAGYAGIVSGLNPDLGAQWRDREGRRFAGTTTIVRHRTDGGGEIILRLAVPNALAQYRATTFATKEPETLRWIDEYGSPEGVLYDIGANVGLYSLYAAARFGLTAFAFEPSVFNLGLLARNCALNPDLGRIHVIPLPLTEVEGLSPFRLSTLDESGALSAFGVDYGFDGQPLPAVLSYSVWGGSLDFLREHGVIPMPPTMMKIDVDGIEHLILRGASRTLREPHLRTVLVEVNDTFADQSEGVAAALTAAGFRLRESVAWAPGSGGRFADSGNQIWDRA